MSTIPTLKIAASLGTALARLRPPEREASLRGPAAQAALRARLAAELPGFAEVGEAIAARSAQAPFWLRVRGLPAVDEPWWLIALAGALGEVIDPIGSETSRLVQPLRPATDSRTGDGEVLNEHLHTDAAGWPEPHRWIALYCAAPDQDGQGVSRLLATDALGAYLAQAPRRRLGELLRRLRFAWRRPDFLGPGVVHAPILDGDRVRFMRSTIDEDALPDARAAAALDDFTALLEACPGERRVDLAAGDLLVVDNRRVLHARTPIEAPARSQRRFHRLRMAG